MVTPGHPTAKIEGGTASLVSANYTIEKTELFQDVTFRLCTTTSSKYALNSVYHASQQEMEQDASWIPQWDSSQPCMSIDPYQTFDASLTEETRDFFLAERIGNRLKISGLVFDTVNLFSNFLNLLDFETKSSGGSNERVLNPVEECWKLSEGTKGRYHSRTDALLGPLILGAYPAMDALNADFYEYCRRFCTPGLYNSLNPSREFTEEESAGGIWERFLRRVRVSNARKVFHDKGWQFWSWATHYSEG
jgi:hypothetical protein